MTSGKMIALTRWTLVGKVMSVLFNMSVLSRFLSKQQVSEFHGYSHCLQ